VCIEEAENIHSGDILVAASESQHFDNLTLFSFSLVSCKKTHETADTQDRTRDFMQISRHPEMAT